MGVCEIGDCGKPSVAKGLCNMHRQRYARHGSVDAARPEGWGNGHGHPLYERWRSMRRTSRQAGGNVAAWNSFQGFIKDVGLAPSPTHRLYRLDETKPFGPGNFTWRERVADKPAGKTRKERAAYQKAWRTGRPHLAKAGYLKRHYGVTVEWYDERLEEQGGACAICRGPERRIDPRSQQPYMLAVDHDHATGAPRALLCSHCNHGLGSFGDDRGRLLAAVAYLDRHSAQEIAS